MQKGFGEDMNAHPWKTKSILLFIALPLFFFCLCTSGSEALLNTGEKAPDFSLKDLEGREFGLPKFKDKKAVVIVFWSTWSANSQDALKRFEEYHRKYRDSGIQVIGINADNQSISEKDVEEIRKFVNEAGISFPVLLDRGLKTFKLYGIVALPSTVVVTGQTISYAQPGWPLEGTEELFEYLRGLAR